MKVFLSAKKDKKQGKFKYGLTVYGDKGEILHSSTLNEVIKSDKFSNHIDGYTWAIKKLKALIENKVLDDQENIVLFVPSKTLYMWFEREVAPEPYTVVFSELLLEVAFIVNPLEIIYSQLADTKTLFINTEKEEMTKVVDLFK